MNNPSPAQTYLQLSRGLVDKVEAQLPQIQQAADWFAQTILAGRMVQVFGSGHSRIMVEEMWPRYGSFPGFNPIVELSLSFHNLVVGANGQRQAMFLENVSGLAERILRNFALRPTDSALVISSSGCNLVPIEMAAGFKARGVKVVAIISRRHSEASSVETSRRQAAAGLRRSGARYRRARRRCDGENPRTRHARRARLDHRRLSAHQRHQSRSGRSGSPRPVSRPRC